MLCIVIEGGKERRREGEKERKRLLAGGRETERRKSRTGGEGKILSLYISPCTALWVYESSFYLMKIITHQLS